MGNIASGRVRMSVNESENNRGRREDSRVCIHEAAHLVVAYRFGLGIPDIMNSERKGDVGKWVTPGGAWDAEWSRGKRRDDPKLKVLGLKPQKKIERTVICLLAGHAAEDRRSHPSLESAASLLVTRSDLLKCGFPSTDLRQALGLLSVHEPDPVKRTEWFHELCKQACQHVWEWWPMIRMVAKVLQESWFLDREGIDRVCERIEAMRPTARKEA